MSSPAVNEVVDISAAGPASVLFIDQQARFLAAHHRRVADLCTRIGNRMGMSDDRIYGLYLAASIHDIGKVHIPAGLLAKPGPLSGAEFGIIKAHVKLGYEMIKDIRWPWPVGEIILQHHERLDGSGYPRGLHGDRMILESRIIAVADVVEAMSSYRAYRRATPGTAAALHEIESRSGGLYDPAAAEACMRLFRDEGYKFPD
jgi:HD-GYP domain-containing protein (c-di-GMP phosphodiesterase class II)